MTQNAMDGLGRRLLRRTSLAVAIAAGAWTLLLTALGGGFDGTWLGLRIRSNDPWRPGEVALAAAALFLAAGGRVSPRRVLRVRIHPHVVAAALALGVAVYGFVYGTKAIGGGDEYGYASEAALWLKGDVKIALSLTETPPWPLWPDTLTPIGYRAIQDGGGWALVPLYPPGFPLMLAGAKFAVGELGLYCLVPGLAALFVLATYGIGCRLGSPGAGLIGAALVATSPVLLHMTTAVMSDVPSAAVWAAAFYFVLGDAAVDVLAAGLAAGLAVLIRPYLAPLVGVLALRYALNLLNRVERGDALRRLSLFVAGVAPSIVAMALINSTVYGSPMSSSYGDLSYLFGRSHIGPNIRNYFHWFVQSQTWVGLLGLAAVFVPVRRLWPATKDRRVFLVVGLFVAALWCLYLPYDVFDAWWYLRFLLPAWPFVMLGLGAIAMVLLSTRFVVLRLAVVAGLASLVMAHVLFAREHVVFTLWQADQRNVIAAGIARRVTPPGSAIMSMQHSGSLRYYGGRMTIRYDFLQGGEIDSMLAWLAERDVHVYLLVEDWELPRVRRHFADASASARLDEPPLVIYEDPGRLFLFDLSDPSPPDRKPEIVSGLSGGFGAAMPGPPPRWALEPRGGGVR